MSTRSIDDLMSGLAPYLDHFDEISREAHDLYMSYDPAVILEHDVRAQASCTYCHMVAAADRRFLDDANVIQKEIRGLKLWVLKDQDVVVRFKKMDEIGLNRNVGTTQQINFDCGNELPGLPYPPVRLTVGYLLDPTGTMIKRTQVARPSGKKTIDWCAAIVPSSDRTEFQDAWIDVTRQTRAAV